MPDKQTNPAVPSDSGTYYSWKPLSESETGSRSLDKKALSVQWVNRRQGTQTCRRYKRRRFQESEEMLLLLLLYVPSCSCSSSRLASASSSVRKSLFCLRKMAPFEYSYAMSKHLLLSRVPLPSRQHPDLTTGKTSFPKEVSVGFKSRLCGGRPLVKQSESRHCYVGICLCL